MKEKNSPTLIWMPELKSKLISNYSAYLWRIAFGAIQVVETVVRMDADLERPGMGLPCVSTTCIAPNAQFSIIPRNTLSSYANNRINLSVTAWFVCACRYRVIFAQTNHAVTFRLCKTL